MNRTEIWSGVILFSAEHGQAGVAHSIASSKVEALSSALREVPDGATILGRNAISAGVEFIEDARNEDYLPEVVVRLPSA